MALFSRKPKQESSPCNCCSGCCGNEPETTDSAVKVLGGGCKNCHTLMDNTQAALQTLGMDDTVELISDPAAIAACGVMSTPALMVDGQVVSVGRVLTPAQAAEAIQKVRG